MNAVFTALIAASIVLMLISDPGGILPAFLTGAGNSLTLTVTLFAAYAFWLSIIKILEKGGALKAVKKLFSPVTKRLFPGESEETMTHLGANIAANFIGAGGAATPEGLKAAKSMKSRKNLLTLVILNSTSLQLIPTTIVAMRSGMGAAEDIILPSIISGAVTTLTALCLTKIFVK